MIRHSLLLLSLLVAALCGLRPALAAEGDSRLCLEAIAEAESQLGIPAGLLQAIAEIESGRDGAPWPWTLNVAGMPVYAANREEAVKFLRDASGQPRSDVAIGCMQVFSGFHLDAVGGEPERLIDPPFNVQYAAHYLLRHYRSFGSWSPAIGRYHAGPGAAFQTYVCAVDRAYRRITAGRGRLACGLSQSSRSTPPASPAFSLGNRAVPVPPLGRLFSQP